MLNVISWLKNNRRLAPSLALLVLAVIVIVAGTLVFFKNHNTGSSTSKFSHDTQLANYAYGKNNKTQALAYARKALAQEPNNLNAIGFVASLTPNHTESQQLYGRMLAVYKNTIGSNDVTAITYWSEANLATKAGDISQAKQYYEESISVGEASSNKYFQSVAQQSQTALKGLE